MFPRLILIAVACVVLVSATWVPATALDKELTIGSEAPALDIEHWIQDGNGFFKPVKKFQKGNVYVVEFWATWCGPCIGSMPHLAELQNKYRGQKVQVISISDETLDTVEAILPKDHPQAGKTFAEVTSAYSLTTDPDRSTHKDYMEAANQPGIPTAFIVGKDSKIEWIGHPMEMDEPLAAIVEGKWDREAYLKEFQERAELEKNYEKISMLAQAKKFDEAIALADKLSKETDNEMIREEWIGTRNSLKLSAGKVDDDVVKYFQGHLKEMKGNAFQVGQFGYSIYGLVQSGGKAGDLLPDAIAAIKAELPKAEDRVKPFLLDTLARLQDVSGNVKEAVASMEAAIESADDRAKPRMQPYLDELKKKLADDK